MHRLLSQLASLPMRSPEAVAIHEQIAALNPKPYTLEDFENDLREKFEPHGIAVRVERRDCHTVTVVTRQRNYALAVGVAHYLVSRDEVEMVASQLLRRWEINA